MMANDTLDLNVVVEKPGAWARRLTITVPAARVEKERKAAVQRLAKNARIPGFRKGKVPVQMMEKRWGPAIEQEAIEKLVGEAYREAIQREGLQPIAQGSVDQVEYKTGSDLTFNVEVEVRPEIELERLGGFTVQRPAADVGDAQVDEVFERLRSEHAVFQPLPEGEAPVVGDMVTVEITPLDDATQVAQGEPRTYQIVLGEGQAVQEIEDVIRLLKPGEEKDFTVDLRENAEDENSATRPHSIHVKMTEAKRPELPALDDAFAQSLGDFDSLDALRARVREDLGSEAERESERALRGQLVAQIVEANPFDVPNVMVDRYLEQMLPPREGDDEDPRMAEMRQQARPMAEQALKRMMVVERVAELESLSATQDEVDARLADIAQRLDRPVHEVRAQLQKNGRLAEIEEEITEKKVFDYLKGLSTIA